MRADTLRIPKRTQPRGRNGIGPAQSKWAAEGSNSYTLTQPLYTQLLYTYTIRLLSEGTACCDHFYTITLYSSMPLGRMLRPLLYD